MDSRSCWVVKIGSAVLMSADGGTDRGAFCRLIEGLANLYSAGVRVVLVTSGAVAVGRLKMALDKRPSGERNIPKLQALAALGQARLMNLYESELAHYGIDAAQVLLTRDDFNHRQRYLNARRALGAIHDFGAIPIINENDSVGIDEIRFGDNDQLAAMVAAMIAADRLVLLSDIDGLYTGDPRRDPSAKRLPRVRANDPSLDAMVGGTLDPTGGFGTGGMRTKLTAARIAARAGIETIIAPGKEADVLGRLMVEDLNVGTLFTPDPGADRIAARKAWIGMGVAPKGKLWCDAGAVNAVQSRGTSLLPSGVQRVEGDFADGDAVELIDPEGNAFARGLAIYNSNALTKIAGSSSSDIVNILGYHILDAVVHRDDLVLLDP